MKDRILKIMEKENLTPAQFAEVVGIQRSAVSHLVTGRNKPSLEVTQKILNTFRRLNSDWLILGVGPMYRGETQAFQPSLFDQQAVNDEKQDDSAQFNTQKTIIEKRPEKNEVLENNNTNVVSENIQSIIKNKIVDKIIVYYSDSTFEEFKGQH